MMTPARAEYETRVGRYRAELEALDRAGGHLANLRTASFLGFLLVGFLVGFERLPRVALLVPCSCWEPMWR